MKKNRWGSKFLAGMKLDKEGKKPPPGQLRLFWDEVDMGNEEIIGVAILVPGIQKARNIKVSWKLGS